MGTSHLSRLLLQHGVMSREAIELIMNDHSNRGAGFAKLIVSIGILSARELFEFIKKHTDFEYLDPDVGCYPEQHAFQDIAQPLIQSLEIVPLSVENGWIRIAMADPLDQDTLQQLKFYSSRKIKPVLASFYTIHDALHEMIEGFEPKTTALERLIKEHPQVGNTQKVISSQVPAGFVPHTFEEDPSVTDADETLEGLQSPESLEDKDSIFDKQLLASQSSEYEDDEIESEDSHDQNESTVDPDDDDDKNVDHSHKAPNELDQMEDLEEVFSDDPDENSLEPGIDDSSDESSDDSDDGLDQVGEETFIDDTAVLEDPPSKSLPSQAGDKENLKADDEDLTASLLDNGDFIEADDESNQLINPPLEIETKKPGDSSLIDEDGAKNETSIDRSLSQTATPLKKEREAERLSRCLHTLANRISFSNDFDKSFEKMVLELQDLDLSVEHVEIKNQVSKFEYGSANELTDSDLVIAYQESDWSVELTIKSDHGHLFKERESDFKLILHHVLRVFQRSYKMEKRAQS